MQILSIEKNKLNDKIKLNLTKAGLKNSLHYEVDYSLSANRNNSDELKHLCPYYGSDKKEISIPLLLTNGKFTDRKITYRLTGNYFKKTN